MADDRRVLLPEGVHDAHVVGDVREHPVGLDRARLGGAAVPADVDRDRPVPRVGERRELMAPRVPGLGEAVDEQHERAAALLAEVDAPAGDVDQSMDHRTESDGSLPTAGVIL